MSVTIQEVKGKDKEYIIKDQYGINSGRVYIIELSKENKYCSIRVKFYKKGNEGYFVLKAAINLFLVSIFKNMRMNKITVMVDEDMECSPLLDLGFVLEGIISNNRIVDGQYKYELIFGMEAHTFLLGHSFLEEPIRGERVELRVLEPTDCEKVLEYYINNKQHLEHFEPTRDTSFYTLDTQKRRLIESYRQYLNGESVNFGIFKGEKLIGKLHISSIIMGVFKNAFVGYSIDKDEQGKGYMKEALNLAIEYCFEELDLNRIEASILVDNVKSQRVLKGCGFKELGLNENYLCINGKWRDHLTYYLVKK